MVLEALAAVSLASSVIEFVDFTVKVISKGNEYYNSIDGNLEDNTELMTISENFVRLSKRLETSLVALPDSGKLSEDEKALKRVVQTCHDLALKLRTTLDRLKVSTNGQKWKSFRQALKAHWSKTEIDEPLNQLRLAREELIIHLLLVMSNRQISDRDVAMDDNQRLEKFILGAIEQSDSRVGSHFAELSKSLQKTSNKKRRRAMNEWQVEYKMDILEVSGEWSAVAEEENHLRIEKLILHSLDFPQRKERHATIAEAHAATFNWLFDHDDL